MLAAMAAKFDPDHPLNGLVVGEHPDSDAPEGWVRVAVRRGAEPARHLDAARRRDQGGAIADGPRLRRGRHRPRRQRGDRAQRRRATTGAATRRSTRSGRCSPRSTTAPAPSTSSCPDATSSRSPHRCRSRPPRASRPPGSPRTGCCSPTPGAARGARCSCRVRVVAWRPPSSHSVAAAGYRVWVTSRSEEKRARAVELGADAAFETGARLPSASTRSWRRSARRRGATR